MAGMTDKVVVEALQYYRRMYEFWLELKLTTDAERELATLKIALIDQALMKEES